jgi:hypothetical protein
MGATVLREATRETMDHDTNRTPISSHKTFLAPDKYENDSDDSGEDYNQFVSKSDTSNRTDSTKNG